MLLFSVLCFFLFCVCYLSASFCFFFFFNDTATTEIYTLSLHDALPIFPVAVVEQCGRIVVSLEDRGQDRLRRRGRSEEHTSELQSQFHLVCRLLLEKKKKKKTKTYEPLNVYRNH